VSAAELRSGAVASTIRAHRLIVVLRRVEPQDRLLALVTALADAGVRAFEITMDGSLAAEDVAAARSQLSSRPDGPFLVGAGTILRRDQLDAARRAGADFGVSPLLDPGLVATAVAEDMPFVPGAMTPTEASTAWDAGATFVKLFPASAVGPSFVRELRGPAPHIALIPTGGIDAGNARAFLDAGAAAVGIGGAIVRASAAERAEIVRSVLEPAS
jgi:2-dehydro-3-deoxyphosphogluconate aldolase/(4S)-4-hydroxy-2-oxoglutarate aldolase